MKWYMFFQAEENILQNMGHTIWNLEGYLSSGRGHFMPMQIVPM